MWRAVAQGAHVYPSTLLLKELEELHQGIKKDIEDKEEAYKRKVYEKSRKKYIKRMTERYEEERAKAIKDGRIDPVKEEEEMEHPCVGACSSVAKILASDVSIHSSLLVSTVSSASMVSILMMAMK